MPISFRSITTHLRPARDSMYATERPAIPPPTTTTSVSRFPEREGNSNEPSLFDCEAVFSPFFISFLVLMFFWNRIRSGNGFIPDSLDFTTFANTVYRTQQNIDGHRPHVSEGKIKRLEKPTLRPLIDSIAI